MAPNPDDGPGRNPVDAHVGSRLRERRKECRLTQKQVGDQLGLTFQQIQKYELGANRVSASRLYELAGLLEKPVEYFFEGIDDGPAAGGVSAVSLEGKETRTFVDAYYKLPPPLRRQFLSLVKEIASGEKEQE